MKHIFKIFMIGMAAITLLPSCKKWLDVQPQDKFTELQVYEDLGGAGNALNGIYLIMAGNALYGNNLTMGTLEVFAQRYNIGAQHNRVRFQSYSYGEQDVMANLASIWENAYVAIVNANQFVKSMELYKSPKITAADNAIMRGEAIGIRAMLHFDLLRMFGPMYNSADSVAKSIPYYRTAATTVAELLPANQVLDSILHDLSVAESLLQNDPIILEGVVKTVVGDGRDFFRNRNQRINYYAIKALQARVQLYRGNKPEALQAAKFVIEQGANWFPWINPSRIINDKTNPDRVFSSELILGLFNINLYNTNRSIFAPEVTDANILAPNDTRLKAIFENNENDYRYNPMWALPSTGAKSYKTFYKYTDVPAIDSSFRFKMPLIRKSELYYIAAECETDPVAAKQYLNTVRYNRGLVDVSASANINTELQKEYQKEFWGEGQLFYFYKRRKVTSVPNSASTSGNVTMNAAKYVFPLPLSETQYR
ncbi:MAG: RagB/SusD family nutrient uptake outer membrane protein [Chitinophagaceae bacterium]